MRTENTSQEPKLVTTEPAESKISFFKQTASKQQAIARDVVDRLFATTKSGLNNMDKFATDLEYILKNGAVVTYQKEKFNISPDEIRAHIGQDAWNELVEMHNAIRNALMNWDWKKANDAKSSILLTPDGNKSAAMMVQHREQEHLGGGMPLGAVDIIPTTTQPAPGIPLEPPTGKKSSK